MDLIKNAIIGGGMHLLRYFLFAGLAYLLFYVIFRNRWFSKKIQQAFPKSKQLKREIGYSMLSIVIFTTFFVFVTVLVRSGFTQVYLDFDAYPAWYFVLSIVIMILWHDTYFYWTHRLLHMKKFVRFHRLHHQSYNTTPWTSFAFHPMEAAVQAGFVPIIVLVLPLHPYAIGIVITWQMLFNVMGHLGYEIFPVWFHKSRVGRLFNTSTHHNMHHKHSHANYGLYFNVWDMLMKTNHDRYEETFLEASERMYSGSTEMDGELSGVNTQS